MEPEEKLAAELAQAGAAIQDAVEALRQKGIGPLQIASAMLGATLGVLAQVMDDNAILNVLHSAATGVSTGELRRSLSE
jgi:biotin operon repressor